MIWLSSVAVAIPLGMGLGGTGAIWIFVDVSFFSQVVAGQIERGNNLISQLKKTSLKVEYSGHWTSNKYFMGFS